MDLAFSAIQCARRVATAKVPAGITCCSGAGVALVMSLCNHRYTATQFALLSSVEALGRVFLGWPAAKLVGMAGWGPFFFVLLIGVFFVQGQPETVSGLKIHTTRWMAANYIGLLVWIFVWMFDQARVRGKNVLLRLAPSA